MTNDRERFIRFMRAMNTIDGEYAALMHGLRVKESLFVLLYACLDEAPRSQKEICDEWRMPRSTLNTAVLEEIKAGNVTLVPCGHKEKLVTLTTKARAYAESLLRPILDAEARIARTALTDAFIAELESVGGEAKTAFSAVGKAPAPAEADVGSLNLESAR
ncbi:MAG: hypothetical protein KH696_05765 [Sutterella sp.]|uniref:hypothetical protein n=1 Tax=Dakarella massiliensis TaxID=1506471 RepID=UPI003A8FD35E|nr:hypothetical protein [Sutterella sp.]